MLFNSFEFLIFFPIVTFLYFVSPYRFRWFILLAASCIFYMAFIPIYILILFITILIDYFAGVWIEKTRGKKKKFLLMTSIFSTCLVLFVFKYFNFFNENFVSIARFFHLNYPISVLNIILPVGLSFHTFQSLSYVIEVYRGKQKAEHHFGIYALYVMFYPQLIAGPIERPQNLLHQFYEKHDFNYRRVTDGLKLMVWGLFKKVVIADRLASYANLVYSDPTQYQGISLIIATVFFAIQIYCDFSGYSDIAIGAAQVMGFSLMDNFNRPYFSKSIAEFWKRWHISLSTWFRDYVYISLGGNRVAPARWYFNLFITFLVSGLWHGANWTYVFWGALNAFYLIFGIITQNIRSKFLEVIGLTKSPALKKCLQMITTFCLVCFSWIFFRAKNMTDAVYIVRNLFSHVWDYTVYLIMHLRDLRAGKGLLEPVFLNLPKLPLLIAGLSIVFISFLNPIQKHDGVRCFLNGKLLLYRWTIYYVLVMGIILFGVTSSVHKQRFIYFQF